MNVKSVLLFGAGFAGGWAARSLADSPQGVGVKLMQIAMNAKQRLGRWAAVERERLEDMMAEARTKVEPAIADPIEATSGSGSGHSSKTANGPA